MTSMPYPDTLGQILALSGFIVFGLTCLAAVLATVLVTRNNLFYLGTQVVLFAVAVRICAPWLSAFGLSAIFPTTHILTAVADTIALMALAFTVDSGLRLFVWRRVMRTSGRQAIPPLLVGAVT